MFHKNTFLQPHTTLVCEKDDTMERDISHKITTIYLERSIQTGPKGLSRDQLVGETSEDLYSFLLVLNTQNTINTTLM